MIKLSEGRIKFSISCIAIAVLLLLVLTLTHTHKAEAAEHGDRTVSIYNANLVCTQLDLSGGLAEPCMIDKFNGRINIVFPTGSIDVNSAISLCESAMNMVLFFEPGLWSLNIYDQSSNIRTLARCEI